MSRVGRAEPAASRWLFGTLLLAAISTATVGGVGTPLLPTVSEQFGASVESAQWILTVTLAVGAIAIPVVGRLGDSRRCKAVLIGTLATVMVGSIIAAATTSFEGLLLGRALQGVGYAVVPLTLSIAQDNYPLVELPRRFGTLSVSIMVGAGLGNPVTGWCVENWNYRVAFALLAALTGMALCGALLLVPARAADSPRLGWDLPGTVAFTIAVGGLVLASSRWRSAAESIWWSATVAVSLAAAILWFAIERRHRAPLVDVTLVSRPGPLGANLAAFFTGCGVFGLMPVVSRQVQAPSSLGGLGQPMYVAGMLLLPLMVGGMISPPIIRWLQRFFTLPTILGLGCGISGMSFVLFGLRHGSIAEVAAMTFLLGLGIGVAYAVMPVLVTAGMAPERTSSLTAFSQVLKLVGGSVGSAVVASVVAIGSLPGAIHPDADGYRRAAVAGVCFAMLAVLSALLSTRGPAGSFGRSQASPVVDS